MFLRVVICLSSLLLPWPMRRLVLVYLLGYDIHKTARIGCSLICPVRLKMGPKSTIGHLNMCKDGVELVQLGEGAEIGNLNWITGVPMHGTTHLKDHNERHPELVVQDQAAITNRHYIDCTAKVTIGRYSTFAGCRSIILTHSIDLALCEQGAAPVSVGDYCFVGAACVLLPGAELPPYSVLGANSLLNKQFIDPYRLYAGSPARPVKELSPELKYFSRTKGYVN
jgi:acetyltransferase-like isoleucine patch superfamily enzyme